jgi:hypothetical protein
MKFKKTKNTPFPTALNLSGNEALIFEITRMI